jgi:hypothetical protein
MMRGPEGLRLLFQRPDIALACATMLGVPTDRVGEGFLCMLPGHDEAHPSASLHWDPKTGPCTIATGTRGVASRGARCRMSGPR